MNRSLIKVIFVCIAVVLAIAVFGYPFPGACHGCGIFQRLSFFIFDFLGLTAFLLPVVIILILFFLQFEKVRKYLKVSLYLWVPVLINLALVRDLFEINANIGGIAGLIFRIAGEHQIDFLWVIIPIVVLDLVVLHFLGVNIPGMKTWPPRH